MTKKGFVLSWFYPPGNSSEGIVTYKLLSHSKYTYDVLTRDNQEQNLWDRKVTEKDLTAANVHTVKVNTESQEEWVDKAVAFFKEHHDEYGFVMSRSMPALAHEAARKIKQEFPEIEWVASFGDPLVGTPYLQTQNKADNPYVVKAYIERESPSRIRALRIAASRVRRAKKLVWEKEREMLSKELAIYKKINDTTIRGADAIIVNNDFQYRHIFSGEYQPFAKKGTVIPHSFDKSLYPKSTKKHKKIIFTYTGHLDNQRNATPFLLAVARLLEHDEKLADKIEINFYGHLSEKDKLIIIDHGLSDIVKLRGDVNYQESLKIMKESDWLLLFDANFTKCSDENIYFPAKLADYIGSGSNIFAVTQLKGATADIIRSVGGGQICSHSVDEIFMYLSKIVYKKYQPTPANQQERKKYQAENVSELLDQTLNGILGND